MYIQIEIPEDFVHRLQAQWDNLPQCTLEALAAETYREGIFSLAEVGRLLGHDSRWQTETFLREKQAYLHYMEDDLAADTESIRDVIQG